MILVFILIQAITVNCYLNIILNNLDGTESLNLEITDKQLGLQKFLAWLTLLQTGNKQNDTTQFGWLGWDSNYNNNQTDMTSVRYPLAFIGYSIAAMVYKTPAYRELSVKIIDNVIRRLIEQHQYEYIKLYWSHIDTFPDPIAYENIMYSGHLAMLISLYESISGDYKYTNEGWYFVWPNYKPIHYDARKLMQSIQDQILKDATGGVCCEPYSIFITCNNHPRIAFALYDDIHGTNFSSTNDKWEKWVRDHARAPIDDLRYFRIIYYKPAHAFIPFYGTTGNDAWTLSFMSWFKDKEFLSNGFEKLTNNIRWKKVSDDQEYLFAGIFGKMSELNTWLATSMYPIVAKQYEKLPKTTNRTMHAYNWFEKQYGSILGINNDTCKSLYTYKIKDPAYEIMSVANLLLSMTIDANIINEMYSRSFYRTHSNKPELVDISYPDVHVKFAHFDEPNNRLHFGLKTDCGSIQSASFRIKNAIEFKEAIQISEFGEKIDITKNAKVDIKNRSLIFSNIVLIESNTNVFYLKF